MRTWKEKSLSALLSAVMVLSLIPTASIPARAAVAVEKPDIDVSDTGKYFDAGIGTGASQALFVNGAFGDNLGLNNGLSDIRYDGKIKTTANAEKDVSTYNMMNCFGMYRKGSEVSKQVDGFSHDTGNNKVSINWGTGQYCETLNLCTYNDQGGKSGSLTVKIADNPTLKTLASSGGLQMYFNGYACAGKESRKAWPDDHTYVNGNLKITNVNGTTGDYTNGSGKAKAQKKAFGTGGWVTLSENSVITISWSVDRSAGKFSNGWADKDVGIGDSVMLFRKVACPNIANYTLTANGDYSTAGSRGAEVLLGNDGRIQLDMNVTLDGDNTKRDVVVSSLGGTKIPYSDDYNLLLQLGKRVLFNNTEGTGYDHQGEPVYMKLTSAKVLNNGGVENKSIEDNDEERLKVLQGGISSLHYEWNASKGDYYGNNPIPGDGDWAGLVSSSNSLNLIDSIVLASFHDLAGNPLMLGGKLVPYEKSGTAYTTNLLYEKATQYEEKTAYYYKEGDVYRPVTSDLGDPLGEGYYKRRNVLTGRVVLNNTTLTGVGNPFAAGNSSDAGCGFVINAVTPTYSRSTNAVQPDVLTQLTLNHGDSFDIALNFSEIVKLREFKSDGNGGTVSTGYAPENLYLELNNGLRARYKSGMGTKQLIFTVSVPAMYTLTVAEPLTWATDYNKYFTKNSDGTYTQVATGSNPQWATDTYYSYVADVTDVTSDKYLEISRMFVETTAGAVELKNPTTANYKTYNGGDGNTDTYSTASDYVLTDYVGNPVCEPIGQKKENSYDTTMVWAKLQVDNTKPQINIEEQSDHTYKIKVTEDGSGVFHVANATQGGGASSGVAYYVWVKNADAQAVCDAFVAKNFEKVKRYSLAPSSADKVTVNGTTYGLTSCIPNSTYIAKPDVAGDWCLLAFTADMTWDSARQLIQYGKANYKTNPTGYLTTLGKELGVSFGDMFEQVTTQPTDWATTYHNYYIKNADGTFSNISKGVEYPAWKDNFYYERKYTQLTEEPDGWDPYQKAVTDGKWEKLSDGRYVPKADAGNYTLDYSDAYTKYYTKHSTETANGIYETYVPVEPISGVPEWKAGYYGYAEVTGIDDDTDLSNYYVRDTDANGGAKYTKASEKYVPDFAPNGVYSSSDQQNYTPVTPEPDDWSTNYSDYYYGVTEYKLYDEWKDDATVAANTYYTRSGEDPNYTYTPVDGTNWNADYESADNKYYVSDGNGGYEKATIAPKFEANKFYSVSYELVTQNSDGKFQSYDENGNAVPNTFVDWDELCSDCYKLNNGVYQKASETDVYAENTYYRIVYGETAATAEQNASEPQGWSTNYKNYATRTVDYQQVTAAYPRDVKYYDRYDSENKEKLNALSDKPADWNTAYYYYSTSPTQYSPVQWVSAPAFAADTYYKYDFAVVATEPTNWPEVYTQYCYKDGNEYVRVDIASKAQRDALNVDILSAAPSFDSFEGRVYKAKEGSDFFVQKLASEISDDTRKAAFTKDMLAASTDAAKIEVIRRYSAFVGKVYKADVAFMASAGGYANWTGNDYSSSDSNWAEPATSGSVDLLAPTVTFGELTGNGSEKVSVPVTVSDNQGASTVKYQFVAADKADTITVETTEGWTTVADANKTSFSASTPDESTGGDYVLCVYAEDAAHNKTLKKQAVTVNKAESFQYSLTEPAGTKPYKEFAGVSATFYGTVYGDNIFARQFKVYAVIDDNATKAVTDADWDAIEGAAVADVTKDGVTYTARSYAMPEIKGVTGYYYLHIKYTYTSNGTTKSEVVNKPYWLEDNKAQITINQTASDDEGITVEITASGASSIQYALTEITVTKSDQIGVEWKTYSNTDKVVISKTDGAFKDKPAVRVWARVNEDNKTARSADFLLSGGSMATGILANPTVELLDVVTEENDKRYAIVRFNNLGENQETSALSVGAEYSVAVAAPNAATDSYVWQRWMPLDNMVKVKLGSGDARLLFKFRNGDAATASNYPTLDVAATAAGTDNAWTVATRSTLRVVNGTTGVTLTLQSKNAQATTSLEAHANGVYEGSNGFRAVVSNINNNPPSYSLVWSDGGEHTGENGVMATSVSVRLASDEDITVKSLTFNGAAVAPSRTYLFKQNGTAVFTFLNEAGVEATATAKVTWLDTKMVLTVTKSYDNYKKYEYETGKYIANGARLTVATNNKQLASLEINGTDVTDEMGLDITRNGTYQVSATSVSGQLVTQKIIVSDIVSSLAAPKQTDTVTIDTTDGKAVVTVKGTASAKNPVRDGRKTVGVNPLQLTANGEYTITKKYTNNGTYTEYVTDSVGNVASYQVKVSVFDTTAPVIKLKNGNKAITTPQTDTDEGTEWIKNALTITDDKTAEENINVVLEGAVDTTKIGAYSVLVKATDEKNNQSMLRVTVYVLPTDGMLVTDQNGVLFCSQSKDAALVTRNGEKQVKLTVQNYDWVELLNTANQTITRAHNAKATLSVTVKQGAFREGQMKYFDTVAIGKIAYNKDRTATITLDVKDLPGTGWYTVLIRNSEREREFTTFFINADN